MPPFLKTRLPCVFVAMTAASTGIIGSELQRSTIASPEFDPPTIPAILSEANSTKPAVKPRSHTGGSPDELRMCSLGAPIFYMPVRTVFPERDCQLTTPMAALSQAYLKCRIIQVNKLVRAEQTVNDPDDRIYDWQYRLMVEEHYELSDEVRMRQLFTLLAASIDVAEGEKPLWLLKGSYSKSPKHFWRDADSGAEWMIDFDSETPVHVAFESSTRRLLVEVGDSWSSHLLTVPNAAALEKLLLSAVPVLRLNISSSHVMPAQR